MNGWGKVSSAEDQPIRRGSEQMVSKNQVDHMQAKA